LNIEHKTALYWARIDVKGAQARVAALTPQTPRDVRGDIVARFNRATSRLAILESIQ
jgi:hypothetical protein